VLIPRRRLARQGVRHARSSATNTIAWGSAYRRTQLCRGRHTGEPNSVGASLLAKALCLADGGCAGLFAGKRAPTRDSTHPDHLRRPRFCRSRLAGEGVVSGDNDGGCAGLFAGKRAPTRDSTHPDHLRRPRFCRSRLAGEGVVSGDNDGGCAGLFAGKRAPTKDSTHLSPAATKIPWEPARWRRRCVWR
jgi:hypothetical protein